MELFNFVTIEIIPVFPVWLRIFSIKTSKKQNKVMPNQEALRAEGLEATQKNRKFAWQKSYWNWKLDPDNFGRLTFTIGRFWTRTILGGSNTKKLKYALSEWIWKNLTRKMKKRDFKLVLKMVRKDLKWIGHAWNCIWDAFGRSVWGSDLCWRSLKPKFGA